MVHNLFGEIIRDFDKWEAIMISFFKNLLDHAMDFQFHFLSHAVPRIRNSCPYERRIFRYANMNLRIYFIDNSASGLYVTVI